MKRNGLIQMTLIAMIALTAAGCAHDQPLADDDHHDHAESVEGFLLLINEQEVHRQFQGEESGVLSLGTGEEQAPVGPGDQVAGKCTSPCNLNYGKRKKAKVTSTSYFLPLLTGR